MMSSLKPFLGAAAIACVAFAAPANASTVADNLDVSATVTSNCVLTASSVAFGSIDVTDANVDDATGSISVTCTAGTAWNASADAGTGSGATLAARKMTSGTNLLSYALYTDSSRTSVWGDGVGGTTSLISDTGTGSAQVKTVYGRVPAGQTTLPAGSYADTVSVTVTY